MTPDMHLEVYTDESAAKVTVMAVRGVNAERHGLDQLVGTKLVSVTLGSGAQLEVNIEPDPAAVAYYLLAEPVNGTHLGTHMAFTPFEGSDAVTRTCLAEVDVMDAKRVRLPDALTGETDHDVIATFVRAVERGEVQ